MRDRTGALRSSESARALPAPAGRPSIPAPRRPPDDEPGPLPEPAPAPDPDGWACPKCGSAPVAGTTFTLTCPQGHRWRFGGRS